MSHLIVNGNENGKLMHEAEIINNMLNLLFASHDTSTSTLVLIIKYPSMLPHVLEKVIAPRRAPGEVRPGPDEQVQLPVFKTSLLGEQMAILCGPAGNEFLFSNESKKVALWWPSSVGKLMGRCLVSKAGDEVRSDKKMFMSFFNLEALIRSVGVIDEVTKDLLDVCL
ncbi:hypothetical protein NL676_031539 [Syzygium grande]|nr:hypothetical protein NL676_031539 [Syzygium grande]